MAKYFHKFLILNFLFFLVFSDVQADFDVESSCCASDIGGSEYCCNNWYLFGDYLYWKASGHGLTYGVSTATMSDTTIPLLTQLSVQSKVRKVRPHFDSGFRIGLGYSFPCTCWSLNGTYTHFSSNASSDFQKPLGTNMGASMTFIPAWGQIPAFASTTAGTAEARWRLHLDEIDLYIARSFCFKDCLSISPLIGLRAARVDQRFNIHYASSTKTPVTTAIDDTIHLKSNFEGIGLLMGIDSALELCWNWSLYGKATASFLYSRFDGRSSEQFERVLTPPPPPGGTLRSQNKLKDHFWDGQAIADLGIGVQWSTPLYCTCLTFKLGWEGHYFFDQTRFEDFSVGYPEVRHFDLNLQGLVVEIGLGF